MGLVPGGTTSCSYDSLSRLRTVTYPDATWSSYAYDPMGNRTELGTGAGTTGYSYDRSDRLLSTSGGQALSFSWDTRGNETAKGTSSFGYDQANRLTSANTGGTASTYAYNGEGVRIGKTVGGVSTSYLQDVVGGLPKVLLETTAGQETLFVYGNGLAWEVRPDGTRRYYHADSLGSTRVVTNDAGSPVSAYSYDAYGAVRASAGEARSFTYTGEETDPESGLEFLRARTYDPATGRFLQRDAFGGNPGRPKSLNRYGYSAGNPIVNTDPNGHWLQILAGAGLGALISYGGQVAGNLRDGGLSTQAFTDVDWRQVGEGAVAGGVGAATFGVGTAVMGSGVLGGMGASAISGVAAGQASRAVENAASGECLTAGLGNLDDMVLEAVSGVGGGVLGYGLGSLAKTAVKKGTTVYRVWGYDAADPVRNPNVEGTRALKGAGPWSRSWTTTDPRSVMDYRDSAGLPTANGAGL